MDDGAQRLLVERGCGRPLVDFLRFVDIDDDVTTPHRPAPGDHRLTVLPGRLAAGLSLARTKRVLTNLALGLLA